MPATATRMVHAVWENYFGVGEGGAGPQADPAAVAQEVEEDPNEEEDEEGAAAAEDALAGGPKGKAAKAKARGKAAAAAAVAKGKKSQVGGCEAAAGAGACAPQAPCLFTPPLLAFAHGRARASSLRVHRDATLDSAASAPCSHP